MAWNLVDALSKPGQRRPFYLPLASIPPGRDTVQAVDFNLFDLSENHFLLAADRESDIALNITIRPPAGGFTNEDSLPHPAIRLHAIGAGTVTFRPSTSAQRDSLVVEIPTFAEPLHTPAGGGVKWWQRWSEAQCIPKVVIYENVDRAQLQAMLNAMPTQALTLTYGLGFPNGIPPFEITEANKANFIAQFLAGAAGYFLVASPGAYLGTAAQDPNNATNRLLKLHVQYQDHTDASPHPMNPRELFYLLFGDESREALGPTIHPLLDKMRDHAAFGQANITPESKAMFLRPPLRTWKRVMWEADWEINLHSQNWTSNVANCAPPTPPDCSDCSRRIYNDHSRQGRNFNNGAYLNEHKCNLFMCDVALRSGFRAAIHTVQPNRWHYDSDAMYANHIDPLPIRDAAGQLVERFAARGQIGPILPPNQPNDSRPYAYKIEGWLRHLFSIGADLQAALNAAMTEEGRCLVLVGRRPGGHHGHAMIVASVDNQPILHHGEGHGISSIRITTREGADHGAMVRANTAFGIGGVGGGGGGTHNFDFLHLFELAPGQDPDTLQGLRDCNVQT